jgi:hypothetical protein
MKIARAIAIITRISFMSDYRSNLKMDIITSWSERVL